MKLRQRKKAASGTDPSSTSSSSNEDDDKEPPKLLIRLAIHIVDNNLKGRKQYNMGTFGSVPFKLLHQSTTIFGDSGSSNDSEDEQDDNVELTEHSDLADLRVALTTHFEDNANCPGGTQPNFVRHEANDELIIGIGSKKESVRLTKIANEDNFKTILDERIRVAKKDKKNTIDLEILLRVRTTDEDNNDSDDEEDDDDEDEEEVFDPNPSPNNVMTFELIKSEVLMNNNKPQIPSNTDSISVTLELSEHAANPNISYAWHLDVDVDSFVAEWYGPGGYEYQLIQQLIDLDDTDINKWLTQNSRLYYFKSANSITGKEVKNAKDLVTAFNKKKSSKSSFDITKDDEGAITKVALSVRIGFAYGGDGDDDMELNGIDLDAVHQANAEKHPPRKKGHDTSTMSHNSMLAAATAARSATSRVKKFIVDTLYNDPDFYLYHGFNLKHVQRWVQFYICNPKKRLLAIFDEAISQDPPKYNVLKEIFGDSSIWENVGMSDGTGGIPERDRYTSELCPDGPDGNLDHDNENENNSGGLEKSVYLVGKMKSEAKIEAAKIKADGQVVAAQIQAMGAKAGEQLFQRINVMRTLLTFFWEISKLLVSPHDGFFWKKNNTTNKFVQCRIKFVNEDNEDQDHNSEYDSEYESGFESREAPKDNATSRVARLPGVFGIGFETPSTFDLHAIVSFIHKCDVSNNLEKLQGEINNPSSGTWIMLEATLGMSLTRFNTKINEWDVKPDATQKNEVPPGYLWFEKIMEAWGCEKQEDEDEE